MSWLERWFLHPEFLLLLATLPLLLWLRRRQRLRRLAESVAVTGGHDLAILDRRRRRWLDRFLVLALVLVILGSAGPRFGRDPEAPPGLGRDVVVVLDVSRSMLAEENRGTSRLDRAKERLFAFVDAVERRGGYRLALIVFAGKAKVVLHLSDDYDAFRYALAEAESDWFPASERVVWQADGSSYGTSLRHALELAVKTHDPAARGFQETLLVSDGDDLAGDWSAAIPILRDAQLPVTVLAVGDPTRDALIPTGRPEEPFVVYGGQPVRTRRHDEVLRSLAEATSGQFVAEEQGPLALVAWFQANVTRRPEREWFADRIPQTRHRFAWLFALALGLMVIELVGSDRGNGRTEMRLDTQTLATAALLGLFWLSGDDVASLLRLGNAAYSRGDFAAALAYYDSARRVADDPGQVAFCRAAALYQLGRYAEADSAYRQTLEDAVGWRRAAAWYGLGNALVRQAEYLPGRAAVQKLREAAEAYQACLAECENLSQQERGNLADDAGHNLEQARLLLARKSAEAQTQNEPADQPPTKPRNDNRNSNPQGEPQGQPSLQPRPETTPPAGQQPRVTEQTRPGRGNLPPLLDDLSAPILSPLEANEYLRFHVERIHLERSRRRAASGTPSEGRDW
ncbi:MAG: VWA domain-containing protein [Gemmatales bacterium]|nr:VWA domain-containing protein [Gemmatales bacterium]MDW8385648.1 VWA domain-containing protein [Gemmatales bacterium]